MRKQIFITLMMLAILSNFVFSAEFLGSLSTDMKPHVLIDNTRDFSEYQEEDVDENVISIPFKELLNDSSEPTPSPQPSKINMITPELKDMSFFSQVNWPTVVMVILALIIVLFLYEFFVRDD